MYFLGTKWLSFAVHLYCPSFTLGLLKANPLIFKCWNGIDPVVVLVILNPQMKVVAEGIYATYRALMNTCQWQINSAVGKVELLQEVIQTGMWKILLRNLNLSLLAESLGYYTWFLKEEAVCQKGLVTIWPFAQNAAESWITPRFKQSKREEENFLHYCYYYYH